MEIPHKQSALLIPAKQAPMVIGTVDVYKPEVGEALVRIEATGLSPADWKIHEWGIGITEFPTILGGPAAGVVVQLGEGVSNLVLGDRILFQGSRKSSRVGTFQQYAVTPAALAVKVPANLTSDEAATLPSAVGTAFNGLYGAYASDDVRSGAGLTPFWKGQYTNQPFVVLSGATSTGQLAIQFAKLSGFSPIIVTASLQNTKLLKSLGATHVVDRSLPSNDLATEIKKIARAPMKYIYEAVGIPEVQQFGYDLLAPGGTLIDVMYAAPDLKQVDNKRIAWTHGGFDYPLFAELASEFLPRLPELLEKGVIKPNIPEYIPGGLAVIPEGLARLKNARVSARKLVVHPGDT
ncbi:GroES-like protein [Panus rudis PR-1116 ss-1]|nr:GroES-like protein [Panus rudis PR-1116 ss-1]